MTVGRGILELEHNLAGGVTHRLPSFGQVGPGSNFPTDYLVVSPTEHDVFKVVHDCHATSKQRRIDHDGWLWRLHLELHLLACRDAAGGGVVPLPVLPFRRWPLDLLVQRGARDQP